jgi:hypothetical protein
MTAQKKFRTASFVADKAIKAPCQAISIGDLTLFGAQNVNGVAVTAGDRVLVNAQTVLAENGIYDVEATAWTRAADWDGERDATNGTIVIVAGDPLISLYQLDVTGTFTIGTSDATFVLMATLDLAGTLGSTANGEGASQIAIEDAADNYVGTDVEAALAELGGYETGSFVTDWFNGFTVNLQSTWNFTRIGKQVTIHLNAGINGTSNTNLFHSEDGDVPASLRPTEQTVKALIGLTDGGTAKVGIISVSTAGRVGFLADVAQNGFVASGQKQVTGGYVFTYLID